MKKQKTSEPWMLQSNQNNAMVGNDGVCYTLVASMGMGGGYVPMIVEEIDDETERKRAVDDDQKPARCSDN